MREFVAPETDTRKVGPLKLDFVFRIDVELDEPNRMQTSRGVRVFQRILGGRVSGPRLNGTVHPESGGEFGLGRADGVDELNTHFMIRDDAGAWLYVQHAGLCRDADGYYRFAAYFDADGDGPHAWLNDTVVIGTAKIVPGARRIEFTYYAVS